MRKRETDIEEKDVGERERGWKGERGKEAGGGGGGQFVASGYKTV